MRAGATHNALAGTEFGSVARLGLWCMAAAVITGVFQGLWELARPVLSSPETFAAAPGAQRWGYGLLAVGKSAGFMAGLYGIYLCATRRGAALKVFMALAALGGVVFAAVWLWIAATGRFTIVYVLGGLWYQMLAPVVLGVAALLARRAPLWKGAWAVAVGVMNSQIFARLGPAWALIVQGVIWLVLGYAVYTCRRTD